MHQLQPAGVPAIGVEVVALLLPVVQALNQPIDFKLHVGILRVTCLVDPLVVHVYERVARVEPFVNELDVDVRILNRAQSDGPPSRQSR